MDEPELTDATARNEAGALSERQKFRPDIEGMRALAVLGVVLFHAGVPGVGGGFVGVDVFFVISGFLIIGLLWHELNGSGTVRMRRFYGARARRILPASALVGVVTAIASVVLLPPLLLKTVLLDGVASALYVSNIWFFLQATDYFTSDSIRSPFEHYWTLGVEEQFYLLAPAVMLLTAWVVRVVGRSDRPRPATSRQPYLVVLLLVVVASLVASVLVTQIWPIAAFFLLPTRAWELALGGLVALTATIWRGIPHIAAVLAGWIGLGAVVAACALYNANTPFPGFTALLPVLGTALMIMAGCTDPGKGVARLLSLPPLRVVGRMSYSWYLWHWPVLIFAPLVVGHPIGLAGRLATVVISAALAALTLRFIENPLRFAVWLRRSASRSLALGGAVTAVAVSVGVVLLLAVPAPIGRGPVAPALSLKSPPGRSDGEGNLADYDEAVEFLFAQVESAVAASANLTQVPSNLTPPLADTSAETSQLRLNGCMRDLLQTDQPECATGDIASSTTVALVGDSNAAMWNPALQQVAEGRQWRLETLAKEGCPLLDLNLANTRGLRREYTECAQWRGHIINRLQHERPRLVVLGITRAYRNQGFTSFDEAWIASLGRLVRQLRGTGANVLVLGPIPDPGNVVPICLSGHLDDVTFCSPNRSKAVNVAGIAAEAKATNSGGGHYADLTALFCTIQRCPVIIGNTLVYLDQVHITREYSRQLAPVIAALVDRALASS